MNNNLKGHNWGHKLSVEQASILLGKIGFFDDEKNMNAFLDEEIEVFSEPWECETTIILHKPSNEVIFFNQRA